MSIFFFLINRSLNYREHERLRVLRHKYHRFLEEDRVRQERNENILRALDRIESQAKTFAAKTDRFKALRKQYNAYIRRIYATKNQQPTVHTQQDAEIHPLQSYPHARKQLFYDSAASQRPEAKIAMLEQYLQDNFNSIPHEKNGDRVLNGNRQFSRQNGYSAGYSVPSEHTSYPRQNYRQSETVADSDSKDSQACSIDNEFPSRVQNELESNVTKCPDRHILQLKKSEKSELLGNTIEQELDRFREKECAKQTVAQKTAIESTHDPYVQNYKDLVSESAKKFGLYNGSLTNSPKRTTTDMKMDIQNEEEINLSAIILDNNIIKSDDSVSDKIISDTVAEQREENKVTFAKHQDNENPIIKEYKELANPLKEENIKNVERNSEKLSSEPELVEKVSPEQNDDEEKLKVLEQDDNVDLRSKTPEVSSARTEPPDDVTLTTPSPIHLPVAEQSIVIHKHESLVPENKKSPVHLDQQTTESPVQQSSISKDQQNDKFIPQVTDTEQTKSTSEKSEIDEKKLTEHQNYPRQHESKVSEEFDQNYPTEASLSEQQPEYPGLDETGQPIDDNQDYPNVEAQQVYQEEEYQPQDGYDAESYPVEEHVEGQPEVYDAEQYPTNQQLYPVDQQQYPADQQQYSTDQQQYSTDQEHYGADQQHYPTDQEHYQEEYPTDQQQYTTDQYPIDPQQYSVADHEQFSVTQQEYPVDKQQYPEDQQYSTDQQQYSTGKEQYPAHQQQYVSDEQYTGDQQQYQEEYPTEQYSGVSQQYREAQPVDYDPAQYGQHYEPDQPYPEGEYDPQPYPEGYNQDMYRSEQEYLQGEQNIDLQYQTELTGEEYQGEVTNKEYQLQQEQQQDDAVEQGHQPHQSTIPQQSSSEQDKSQMEQENSLAAEQNISESTEKSVIQNVVPSEEKPVVEKKLPNLADMLDTDTESTKQETKVSNESDFDFSNT